MRFVAVGIPAVIFLVAVGIPAAAAVLAAVIFLGRNHSTRFVLTRFVLTRFVLTRFVLTNLSLLPRRRRRRRRPLGGGGGGGGFFQLLQLAFDRIVDRIEMIEDLTGKCLESGRIFTSFKIPPNT
jgi:hypothetical protein